MAGRKYVFSGNRTRITLEKQWHSIELKYPLQTVVADIDVHDAAGKQYSTIEVRRDPSPSFRSSFFKCCFQWWGAEYFFQLLLLLCGDANPNRGS
jgi:hypothetical protein